MKTQNALPELISKMCIGEIEHLSTAESLYYPLLLTEWASIVLLYPQLHATVVK